MRSQENVTQSQKQGNQQVPMLRWHRLLCVIAITSTLQLLDKDFKLAILNMFIKVKVYRLKIKNLNREVEKVKSKLNENTELKNI